MGLLSWVFQRPSPPALPAAAEAAAAVSPRPGRNHKLIGSGAALGTRGGRYSAMAAAVAVAPPRAEIEDRLRGALWGSLIGDALAAPSHWYYGGEGQVRRDYGGRITGYVKPVEHLAGSIMNKSSTGGGGRGNDSGSIIGDVRPLAPPRLSAFPLPGARACFPMVSHSACSCLYAAAAGLTIGTA